MPDPGLCLECNGSGVSGMDTHTLDPQPCSSCGGAGEDHSMAGSAILPRKQRDAWAKLLRVPLIHEGSWRDRLSAVLRSHEAADTLAEELQVALDLLHGRPFSMRVYRAMESQLKDAWALIEEFIRRIYMEPDLPVPKLRYKEYMQAITERFEKAHDAEERHQRYMDRIGGVLEDIRERRDTGEPARSDFYEIRQLRGRAETAEKSLKDFESERAEIAVALPPGSPAADEPLAQAVRELVVERAQLLQLTRVMDEHPEGYDGPCECQTCMGYAAADAE